MMDGSTGGLDQAIAGLVLLTGFVTAVSRSVRSLLAPFFGGGPRKLTSSRPLLRGYIGRFPTLIHTV